MRSKKRAAEQNITPKQAKRVRTTIDDLINKIVGRYDARNFEIADLFNGLELTSEDFRKKAPVSGSRYDGLNLCALIFTSNDFNLLPEGMLRELSLANIKAKSEESPNKGLTALWVAVGMDTNRVPAASAFNFIIEKFGPQLTVEDFRAKAEEGTFKGKSVLDLVRSAYIAHLILAHTSIIDAKLNIYPSPPGFFPPYPGTTRLYQTKRDFLIQLSQLKAQNYEGNTDLLVEAAKNANKAGFQLSDIMLQKVFKYKFTKALSEATRHSFSSEERSQHLSTALTFALKILDDTKRAKLIHDVANHHIVERPLTLSMQERNQGLIPERLLKCMLSEGATIKLCFAVFDSLKEARRKDDIIHQKNETINELKSQLEQEKANHQAPLDLPAQNHSKVVTLGFDDLQKQARATPSFVFSPPNGCATNRNDEWRAPFQQMPNLPDCFPKASDLISNASTPKQKETEETELQILKPLKKRKFI